MQISSKTEKSLKECWEEYAASKGKTKALKKSDPFEDEVKKCIQDLGFGVPEEDLNELFAEFMKTQEKKDIDNAMDYILTHF